LESFEEFQKPKGVFVFPIVRLYSTLLRGEIASLSLKSLALSDN